MRKRIEIVTDLVQLKGNLNDVKNELAQYAWDIEEPLIVMSVNDFINVIQKVINDKLTFNDLENWANLIEARDDIEFEVEQIQEYIFELANPEIHGKLTKRKLKEILNTFHK